jgi:hypothetical protein
MYNGSFHGFNHTHINEHIRHFQKVPHLDIPHNTKEYESGQISYSWTERKQPHPRVRGFYINSIRLIIDSLVKGCIVFRGSGFNDANDEKREFESIEEGLVHVDSLINDFRHKKCKGM